MGIDYTLVDAGGSTATAPPSSTPIPATENNISYLAVGGQVVWVSGLTFRVSAAQYYIRGVLYESTEQSITLDAADGSNDRIDVIALDTLSAVVKVTGTPATPAGEPSIDPETQLKLIIVTVPVSATVPNVSNTTIYAQGAAGEWTDSTSGSGWSLDSTNNPRTSTKCEEATGVAAAAYIQWLSPVDVDLQTVDKVVFYIRSKATWPVNKMLRIRFQATSLLKGVEVTLRDGYWGFDSSVIAAYQQVAIPISQFQVPLGTLVNTLRMVVTGSGGTIGFYLDDIFLQDAIQVTPATVTPSGLTSGEFITAGLVAGYKFDQLTGQVVHDYGPYGYHGVLGATSGVEGTDPTWVSPRGVTFDGVDDIVTIPTPNAAMRLTTALSVEVSFKLASSGGIFDKTGAGVTNKNYLLIVGTPTTTFRVVKATVNQDNPLATDLMVNGRYHMVVTYDGIVTRIYLNGVELGHITTFGQKEVASPIDNVDGAFLIGSLGSAALPFGGTVYKVAVYNRCITPFEINTLNGLRGF